MSFVAPSDALAYLARVDADVWRLSRAVNDRAPALDPWVLGWKRWRTEWMAFNVAAAASGATWNTVAVFEEIERRELQLKGWYAEARAKGWAPVGPGPVGPPGESGAALPWLLLAAVGVGAVVVWKVTR